MRAQLLERFLHHPDYISSRKERVLRRSAKTLELLGKQLPQHCKYHLRGQRLKYRMKPGCRHRRHQDNKGMSREGLQKTLKNHPSCQVTAAGVRLIWGCTEKKSIAKPRLPPVREVKGFSSTKQGQALYWKLCLAAWSWSDGSVVKHPTTHLETGTDSPHLYPTPWGGRGFSSGWVAAETNWPANSARLPSFGFRESLSQKRKCRMVEGT